MLVATATGALMVPAKPSVLAHLVTPRRYLDPGYLSRVAGNLYGGSARTNPGRIATAMNDGNRVGPSRGYLYQLTAGAGWTSLPFLPLLRQPALIIAGDDDPIIPLANARLMHRLIPNSRLHVYHGGHLGLVTEAARISRSVVDGLTKAITTTVWRTSMTRDAITDADFYLLERQLPTGSRELLHRVREYMEKTVQPVINHYWTREEFPHDLVAGMGELGIAGLGYEGYDCPGRDCLLDGMVSRWSWPGWTRRSRRSSACTAAWRWDRSTCAAATNRKSAGSRPWRGWRRSARSASPSRTSVPARRAG